MGTKILNHLLTTLEGALPGITNQFGMKKVLASTWVSKLPIPYNALLGVFSIHMEFYLELCLVNV